MSYRIRNTLFYAAIVGCLIALLPNEMQWHHWLALASLWILINIIDVDSYRAGLDQGAEIVRDFPGAATRSAR